MITTYHSSARARTLTAIDEFKAGSWVHAVQPAPEELDYIAEKFELERDLLGDAIDAYEAPRVEVEGGVTYVFARYCRPEDPDIPTEPILIVYTQNAIVTIMRSNDNVLEQLFNGTIPVLTTQKAKTFLHILEQINRSYRLQLNTVAKQILRFRAQLRQSDVASVEIIRFIELEEDLNEFLSALQPQGLVLKALQSGKYMRLYDDDRDLVEDIMLNTNELIELSKSRLRSIVNIRQAYDVIATNNLNKTFRRLTSIAIFLSIPTVISGLFGMNVLLPLAEFKYMFVVVLLIIVTMMLLFFRYFRKRNWL
jgi:magnesium transporter